MIPKQRIMIHPTAESRGFCVPYHFLATGNLIEVEELPADTVEPVQERAVWGVLAGSLTTLGKLIRDSSITA